MAINLASTRNQFWIGLLVHLTFVLMLYAGKTSQANLQLPEGPYANNIWQCSDVMTYVDPARNYIEYGVFGQGASPDHNRTIGYPALIAFFMSLFGKNWLFIFQFFQAALFACLYPLITLTARLLLPHVSAPYVKWLFILLLPTGTYFTKSAFILTDTLFVLFFIAGFYFGIKSYLQQKNIDFFWYLLFITLAALVRPTLSLFPMLNLILAYWVARKNNRVLKPLMLKAAFVSVLLLILVNISTFRNYYNYGFASPSSIIGINAFHYLAKKVLAAENKADIWEMYAIQIDSMDDIRAKTNARKSIMYHTILDYPGATLQVLGKNAINVLFFNHLLSNISIYYNYDWKQYSNACFKVSTSALLYYGTYLLMIFYFLLWLFFAGALYWMIARKDYITVVLLLFIMVMFLVPAILTGDGGSRFRLPIEHFLFIYALDSFYRWHRRHG